MKKSSSFQIIWCTFVFCLLHVGTPVSCFQWTRLPNATVHVCTGKKADLVWNFTLPGEMQISDVQWTFNNGSNNLTIATLSHELFSMLSSYLHRVTHVDRGGIILSDVTAKDSGTYTVEVNLKDFSDVKYQFNNTVRLEVGDEILNENGKLEVTQSLDALWEEAEQKYVVQLKCGGFPWPRDPPFQVDWNTPAGVVRLSSDYQNGQFFLSLPPPVLGGYYTCSIPDRYLPSICLKDHDRAKASVLVDAVQAQLSILQAEHQTLRQENAALKEELGDQKQKVDRMEQSWGEAEVGDRQALANLTNGLEELEEKHESDMANLTGILDREDQSSTASPVGTTVRIYRLGECAPGQYATLDESWRSVNNTVQNSLQCDSRLSPGWKRFLIDGKNAVMPTTCVPTNRCRTHAPIWFDLQGVDLPGIGSERAGRACAHWSSNCCKWESPITVKNCGDFLIYHVQPRSTCKLAYCAQYQTP